MKLKIIGSLLFILIIMFLLHFSFSSNMDKVRIMSELKYNKGENSGTAEFTFSLKNTGEYSATLKFPTYLEYNYSLGSLSDQNIQSGIIQDYHLDLNQNESNGRTVILKPNEKLEYSFIISNLPPGKYNILVQSASGYGNIVHKNFSVD